MSSWAPARPDACWPAGTHPDRKSTRLNSSHEWISYAVFCLKKKKKTPRKRNKQKLKRRVRGEARRPPSKRPVRTDHQHSPLERYYTPRGALRAHLRLETRAQ